MRGIASQEALVMKQAQTNDLHPILECIINGVPANGISLFAAIHQPSAEDETWFGLCLLNLNRPYDALGHFIGARADGFEDSGVFLVVAQRLIGELDQAKRTLETLSPSHLSGFGQATAECERGILCNLEGRFSDATVALENAWTIAAGDSIASQIIGSFSSALGIHLAEQGMDTKALAYLDRALSVTQTGRAYLLATRGWCHTNTGAFDKATSDLNNAAHVALLSPVALPQIHHYQGILARTQGLLERAASEQLEASNAARATGDIELEFDAELELAAIATASDDLAMAQAHLSRARKVVKGLRSHALLSIRQAAILTRANAEGVLEAIPMLEKAAEMLEGLEIERDVGLAQLHLAEAFVRAQRYVDARKSLGRVVNARHYLGNGTIFARELRSLPAAFELLTNTATPAKRARRSEFGLMVLLEDWRALEGTATSHVTLTTLGGYGLAYNGVGVHLRSGLARSVETLAFLLDEGEATLEMIESRVFTDVTPLQARGSLHLIKRQVAKAVPGLSIPYDPDSKTYRVVLSGNLRLHWDALEVKESVRIGGEIGLRRALGFYAGPFLPRSTSDWADEYRHTLGFQVATLGAEALENLLKLEQYESCVELSQRLLEMNQLAIDVWIILVRATRAWRGEVAGRQAFEYAANILKEALGEVPPTLLELQQERWFETDRRTSN